MGGSPQVTPRYTEKDVRYERSAKGLERKRRYQQRYRETAKGMLAEIRHNRKRRTYASQG